MATPITTANDMLDVSHRMPQALPDAHRAVIVTAAQAWAELLQTRLVSLVLFGSVARGEAHATSDIDLLVVADGLPRSLHARC